jgi:putative MFS transporter
VSQSAPLTPEIIGRAIDNIRLNRALKFIIGVAAAGFLFDSFDITIVGYALPKIRQEFGLSPTEIGIAGSAALAGMGVGSWCWGWVADKWGRRVVFASTVLMFSVFTGIAGVTTTLGFFVGARFLTGLGLGGMVPIDQALVTEYAPARIRGRVAAMLPLCWPMGYFTAAGMALWLVPSIGWRWLFAIGVLPAILVFFIRRGVPESPRWLAAHGRHAEARESLAYVGVTDDLLEQARRDVAAAPVRPAVRDATFRDLFTPDYAKRVIHTWLLWFCSNFAATGFSIWLPTIYSTYYHIELTRTLLYTFIVAGTQVVGRICAFGVVDMVGRKRMIIIAYAAAGCAALAFTQATTEMSLLINAMVYVYFQDIGNLAMTVYTPEVYPVRIRGKCAALAMGWGRFGGMTSPVVAGVLIGGGNLILVWGMLAVALFIASGLTAVLAYDTRGNLETVSRAA